MAQLKKSFHDYSLFAASILINYVFAIRILQESELSKPLSLIIGILLASILSYFMYIKWKKTFELVCITTHYDIEQNFKVCHHVIKTYPNKIITNNFDEKLIQAKLQLHNFPIKVFTSFFFANNEIYVNSVPTFNFSILLFAPSGLDDIKNKIENTSL